MKYTEEKIASLQTENNRWQLLKMTKEIIGSDGIPTDLKEVRYQIRQNRKVLYNYKWEGPARQQFAYITKCEILQLNLFK